MNFVMFLGARVWVIYHTTVRVEENVKTEDLTLTESGKLKIEKKRKIICSMVIIVNSCF